MMKTTYFGASDKGGTIATIGGQIGPEIMGSTIPMSVPGEADLDLSVISMNKLSCDIVCSKTDCAEKIFSIVIRAKNTNGAEYDIHVMSKDGRLFCGKWNNITDNEGGDIQFVAIEGEPVPTPA